MPHILKYGVKASIYAKRALETNHFDSLDNFTVSHELKAVPDLAKLKGDEAKKIAEAKAAKEAEEAAKLAAKKKAEEEAKAAAEAKNVDQKQPGQISWEIKTVSSEQETGFLYKTGHLIQAIDFVKTKTKPSKLDGIQFNQLIKVNTKYIKATGLKNQGDNFYLNSSSILNEGHFLKGKTSMTISLTSLTIGETYYFDLIIINQREEDKSKKFKVATLKVPSISYFNENGFTLIKGEFTATSSMKRIELQSPEGKLIQLNALQLRSKNKPVPLLSAADAFKKYESTPKINNIKVTSQLTPDITGTLSKKGKLIAAINYDAINSDEMILIDEVKFRSRASTNSKYVDCILFDNNFDKFANNPKKSSFFNYAKWCKGKEALLIFKELIPGKTYTFDYIYNDNRSAFKDRTISFDNGKTYLIASSPDATLIANCMFKATHESMALNLKTKDADAIQINAI